MEDDRIPVSKPKAELKEVYKYTMPGPDGEQRIRFITPFGKVFERAENRARGVVWYQVVQR